MGKKSMYPTIIENLVKDGVPEQEIKNLCMDLLHWTSKQHPNRYEGFYVHEIVELYFQDKAKELEELEIQD